MAFAHKLGEELEEECYRKETYVHAVDIGVGGHDDLVIAQSVESVLYVEGGL